MKKTLTLLAFLAVTLFSLKGFSQNVIFSETFVQGQTATSQCNAWVNFRAQLIPANNYVGFTVTSNLNPTGWTCTDPSVAAAVANALHTSTPYTGSSDGQTWYVSTGCGPSTNCGGTTTTFANLYSSNCQCYNNSSHFMLRPQINNLNWGGTSGPTCNAPTQTITVTFIVGQASGLHFDGVDDLVQLGQISSSSAISIEAWVKPELKNDFLTILSNKIGGFGNVGFIFAINEFQTTNGKLIFETSNAAIVSNASVAFNVWQHVAFTYDGTIAKMYINGVDVGTTSVGAGVTLLPTNTAAVIGDIPVYFASGNYQGAMDEVRVWNYARSGPEIVDKKDCELTGTETGLVSYYNFNNPNAIIGANNAGQTTLDDRAATNNTGTLQNFALNGNVSNWSAGANVNTCIPATGLSFDGNDDYVDLPDGLVSTTTDFTIEAWFYMNANTHWQRIIDFGNNSQVNMFLTPRNSSTGTPRFAITTNFNFSEQQITAPSSLNTGQWYHIAVTIDATSNTGTMYIDGYQVAQNTNMTLNPSSLGFTSNNFIGESQYTNDPEFNGIIDEVRLWNVAKSGLDIMANKDCELNGNEQNLIAYYNFNNGIVAANNSGLSTLVDQSSNGNDGTLSNFSLNGITSNWAEGQTFAGPCSPPLNCSITLPNKPIDPLYSQYGASDPNTYYPGLSGGKAFTSTVSGGTAPYTYQWTTSTGGNIIPFANKPNKAQLNYTATIASGNVQLIVTDANGVTCTSTVAVPVVDFTCPPEPGMLWYYQLCNTQTNISTCVHGTANMRALLQTGNYVFGTCSNPTKTNYTMGENEYLVYPNPTTGNATLQYFSATNAAAQISVVDLNGRVLLNQDVQLHEGVVEHMLDLSTLSDGFYFVQLRTENDAQVQRIQVMK